MLGTLHIRRCQPGGDIVNQHKYNQTWDMWPLVYFYNSIRSEGENKNERTSSHIKATAILSCAMYAGYAC